MSSPSPLPQEFYGTRGGGASGAGFEVFCQRADGKLVTLVTGGGGGGGGGMTSPEEGHPIEAGGGGGGGALIGANGRPMMGAGLGNHPLGYLDVNSSSRPLLFAVKMLHVKKEMGRCIQEGGRVVLMGGGGGGTGFNFFDAAGQEIVPHALSHGYGFRFQLAYPSVGYWIESTIVEAGQATGDSNAYLVAGTCKLDAQTQASNECEQEGKGAYASYTTCNCPKAKQEIIQCLTYHGVPVPSYVEDQHCEYGYGIR